MLFAGLLLFLFLQIIRPQDFIPGLIGTRIVLYVMGVLLAGWAASSTDKRILRAPQDKFMGLFFLAIVISTFNTGWITFTTDTAIAISKTALIYYFIVTVVDSEKRFKIATWAILVLMSYVAILGVLAYHGYEVMGATKYFSIVKEQWAIKGVGMFDNPNDLAYSVAFVVPFAVSYILQASGCFTRFVLLNMLAVSVACIYYTRSRGGLLALGVSLALWFWFWLQSPKWRKRYGYVLACLIVVLFAYQTKGFREDESAMGRIDAWDYGVEMLRSHPIIGVGFDQFIEFAKRDSHSSYVRAAAELGLFGLYAYMGVLVFSIVSLNRVLQREDKLKWRIYYAGYAGYFGAYLVGSVFSTRTYDGLFLIIVALVSVFGRMELIEKGLPVGETFTAQEEDVMNRKVFFAVIGVLVGWKLFMGSVW